MAKAEEEEIAQPEMDKAEAEEKATQEQEVAEAARMLPLKST